MYITQSGGLLLLSVLEPLQAFEQGSDEIQVSLNRLTLGVGLRIGCKGAWVESRETFSVCVWWWGWGGTAGGGHCINPDKKQ